ncbi:hypothetical protein evm_005582 [Chilo suppressalis]|nr:hypothetical protein evm_005582 [Chilo suppressalis]
MFKSKGNITRKNSTPIRQQTGLEPTPFAIRANALTIYATAALTDRVEILLAMLKLQGSAISSHYSTLIDMFIPVETSCGGSVQNNLTYFLSPGFPELWTGSRDCNITIEKTHAGITQLRIDFVHFTIGQPNRTTGECDEDVMTIGEGGNKFVLCGQNHGQHIYYTLPSGTESREADELPSTKSTLLSIRMRGGDMPRLWLMRLAQMPLANSAPHDCLQYHTADNGTIQTFNFAVNGRHIAGQQYRACVRKNSGRCAVRYTPCDDRSFRIGPGRGTPDVIDPAGSMDQVPMMPADDQLQEEEGSGADPQAAPVMESSVAQPSLMSRIWRFIWPSWLWGQRSEGRSWGRWSPYKQHYVREEDELRYYGYGNFGATLPGFGRKRCSDRITIPCENEYFISSSSLLPGVCDPHHCGFTFCAGVANAQCRVETSISPFAVSVHFGPPTPKRSPEENIGACLRYSQLPCDT